MNATVQEKRRNSLKANVAHFLKILGPGIITGAADDDPSGIATYSQTGAQFGFGQLWTALYQIPLLLAVQEACGRIGAVTGKGLAGVIKDHYARKILIGVVVLVAVANTINIGADIGAVAAAAQLVVNVPFWVLAVGTTLALVVSEVLVTYKTYANVAEVAGAGAAIVSGYDVYCEAAVEADPVCDSGAAYRIYVCVLLHHYGGVWDFDLALYVFLAGFGGGRRGTDGGDIKRQGGVAEAAAKIHPRFEDRYAGGDGVGGAWRSGSSSLLRRRCCSSMG